MGKQLVKDAAILFESAERWQAFLSLTSQKDEIRNQWYSDLKIQVTELSCQHDLVAGWSFNSWNAWDFRWFLTEFGRESFCIWMWGNRIGLWANPAQFDTKKISELLASLPYATLFSVLRNDEVFSGDWKLVEYGNFHFGDANDGHLSADQLAWYAGNRTAQLAGQIMAKVNSYRKDELFTQLLTEINRACKR